MPRRGKKPKRTTRLLAAVLIVLLAGTITGGILWRYNILQPWIRNAMLQAYIKKVAPLLPFKIEQASVDADWEGWLQGRINRLSAIIRWGPWRIRLAGPFDLDRDPDRGTYAIEFHPEMTIEPAKGPLKDGDRSPVLRPRLEVAISQTLTHINSAAFDLTEKEFKWPLFGIELKGLANHLHWDDQGKQAVITLGVESLAWAMPGKTDQMLSIQKVNLVSDAPLQLDPLQLPEDVHWSWNARSAEVLWGDLYLDVPLQEMALNGHVQLAFDDPQSRIPWRGADLELGRTPGQKLNLTAKPQYKNGELSGIEAGWKTGKLPIPALLKGLIQATAGSSGLAAIQDLKKHEFRSGTIQTQGHAVLPLPPRPTLLHVADGELDIRDMTVASRQLQLAIKGLELHAPFSLTRGVDAQLAIREILFRKLRGNLLPTDIHLKPTGSTLTQGFTLEVGRKGMVPVSLKEIPLQIQAVRGKWNHETFEISTATNLEPTPIEALAHPLCLSKSPPPGTVSLRYPKITLTPDSLEPDGETTVDLFEGKAQVSDLAVYDYGTEFPEIGLSIEGAGFRLDQFAEWMHFGKMTGLVKFHLKDVEIHGSIPTAYNFSFDLTHPPGRKAHFAARAVKNIVRILGGEDAAQGLDALDLFAFSLNDLLGGYEIIYSGISAYSRDGTILIETHDPEEVKEYDDPKVSQHFILLGKGFKIPLQSKVYPVIVDSTYVGSILKMFQNNLREIARENLGKSHNADKETSHENTEQDSEECLPADF